MKKSIPFALFLVTTAGLMYSGSRTVANANFGGERAPDASVGIDVSISAIAHGTGAPTRVTGTGLAGQPPARYGPGGNLGVYTSSSAGKPSPNIVMSATTVSCNTRPNNTGQTINGTFYAQPNPEWWQAWDSAIPTNDPRGGRHPYIAINTFRTTSDGRLEQLGAAWVKHGWFAASATQGTVVTPLTPAGTVVNPTTIDIGQPRCGTLSCNGPSNDLLGANCSDTYGSGLNVAADDVGPRSEIKPNAPAGTAADPGTIGWSQQGSWHNLMNQDSANPYQDVRTNFATTQPALGARNYNFSGTTQAWKLNNFHVDKIKPAALGTNGRFFVEGYYVINGDKYKFNNVAYRRFEVTGVTNTTTASSVGAGNFLYDSRHIFGPVMLDWGDRQAAFAPTDEGTAYVSSRVVSRPGGGLRYEYCVYNLDLDRELNALELVVPRLVDARNFGFAQPRSADPGYHSQVDPTKPPANADTVDFNTDWTMTVNPAGSIRFTPPTAPSGVLPNTLRWGRMFTFWFDSDMPPTDTGQVNGEMRRTGTAPVIVATGMIVPKNPADIALADGSAAAIISTAAGSFRNGSVDGISEADYNLFFSTYFEGDAIPNSPADIAYDSGEPLGAPSQGTNNGVTEGDYNCFFSNFFN
ncbi:MAG: hypothetical protein K2X32_10010 [Phycisphaerales bacterium]|nr:hypothetical protein [Phycisphaerales bacterium]